MEEAKKLLSKKVQITKSNVDFEREKVGLFSTSTLQIIFHSFVMRELHSWCDLLEFVFTIFTNNLSLYAKICLC